MTANVPADRFVTTADILAAIKGHEPDVLDALNIRWRDGKPHVTCPYRDHDDNNPSWRWDDRKKRACCSCTPSASILDVVMKVEGIDLAQAKVRTAELLNRSDLIRERRRKKKGEGGSFFPRKNAATAQHPGCTLAAYAKAKGLPAQFLRSVGLSEIKLNGIPVVRIPYFDATGAEAAVRFRIALDGKDRFRWRKGSKPCLYGLNRLGDGREIIIVEGESDVQTLWQHGFAALGLPGAGNWNEQRDAPLLAELTTIYIVIDSDRGGDAVMGWLCRSSIAPRVRLVRLQGAEDPSALYLSCPDGFRAAFRRALDQAEPYQAIADREAEAEAAQAREAAGDLVLRAGHSRPLCCGAGASRPRWRGQEREGVVLGADDAAFRAARIGRGQGAVERRQVLHRRGCAEVLCSDRILVAHRDERASACLLG